jgi:hypothetical protein
LLYRLSYRTILPFRGCKYKTLIKNAKFKI